MKRKESKWRQRVKAVATGGECHTRRGKVKETCLALVVRQTLFVWAGAISIIYLTALKRSKAFKAELQKVWADRGETAEEEKGLTKWWQAVRLACLREGRVHSGLGQRRKGHLTGVRCHRWAERRGNQRLLWWGRMMRKINIYGFPQSNWIVNIIYGMPWTHLLPW